MKSVLFAAACAALVANASNKAKSEYVSVLEPGKVFAPRDAVSGAGVEPVVDTDMVFPAVYVDDFAVDGDMDKSVWKKAKHVPELCVRLKNTELPCRSDIRILYSKTAIYIGATLWQDMSQVTAKWDQRDQAIWNDDNIEMFLFLPSASGNRLLQFVLNPLNSLADLRDGDKSYWVRGNKHATRRFGDRWTMEIKLPFAGLPMDRPVADDFIGIRFCRTIHAPTMIVGASPVLLSPGHAQRSRFAKLLFSKPEGKDSARLMAEGVAYRRETQRKRFYEGFKDEKSRFAEIRGCAVSFSESSHPLHKEAWAGVRQMEKALASFEKRFSRELADEKEIPSSEAAAILAEFAGFRAYASKYAYVVWETSPWERGSPDDLPPKKALPMPSQLAFEQAGNEREQVCINIAGLLCGKGMELRLHPYSIERTKTRPFLSTDCFEVAYEPFVRFGGELITAPHIRAPGNVISVFPGRTSRVWISFNSRGVQPGNYSTRIAFKSLNNLAIADRDLPVSAKVWNFSLPKTRDWPIKSFCWGPWSFAEDEVALLELMHNYHVTHGWSQKMRYQYGLYDDRGWYRRPNKGKGKEDKLHDFEDEYALHGNEMFLNRAKELGMRFVIGWGTPLSVDWFKTITKRFLAKGFEYDDFVFHGLLHDEFSKKMIPIRATEREAIWNWNTNLCFLATYLSTPPPTGATMDDIEEAKLPEFFKTWAVIHGRCRDPKEGPDTIGRLRSKGCKVWSYRCNQFMQGHSILGYYRFYPWDAYMLGLDGFAYWTVYSPKGDDGWDSRDGYDEGFCWRGLDKKPIPTKILEAVREGLEDVAYMDLLKRSGNAAAKLLLDARGEIIKANDQKVLDSWRLSAGRLIDELSRQRK